MLNEKATGSLKSCSVATWMRSILQQGHRELGLGEPCASSTTGFYVAQYLAGQSLRQTKHKEIRKSELVPLN